ncbi:MAG: hypothetical protein ACKVHE_34390, partial [Planctomycetales bacterium]
MTAGGSQMITIPVTYQTFDGSAVGGDPTNTSMLGTADDFEVTSAVDIRVLYDNEVFTSAPTAGTSDP